MTNLLRLFGVYTHSFIFFIAFVIFLQRITITMASIADSNQTLNTIQQQKLSASASSSSSSPSSRPSTSDEYVTHNQKQCFESRSLVACIKYKAAKIVWKVATNGMGFFPNEYGRELREDKRRIRFIQLGQAADEIVVFNNARSLEGLYKSLVYVFKQMYVRVCV